VRKTLIGVVAALAAVSLLTGCEGRAGAAAVVDGRVIATSDVSAALGDLAPVAPSLTALGVVRMLAAEPMLEKIGSERDITVTDQDATDLLDSVFTGKDLDVPSSYSSASVVVGRYSVLLNDLEATDDVDAAVQELSDMFDGADISISPRFASEDADGGFAEPTAPAWIVSPTTTTS
jgi:hypothetical protein